MFVCTFVFACYWFVVFRKCIVEYLYAWVFGYVRVCKCAFFCDSAFASLEFMGLIEFSCLSVCEVVYLCVCVSAFFWFV